MPLTKEEEIQMYLNCADSIDSEEEEKEDETSEDLPKATPKKKRNEWNQQFSEKSPLTICE